MTIEPVFDDQRDQFPIGMRVLIVDDDVTCLRVLETMLHKCQYHGVFVLLLFSLFGFCFQALCFCLVLKSCSFDMLCTIYL